MRVPSIREAGAGGAFSGCAEAGVLIGSWDFDIPTFDTTRIPARAALDFALSTT